MITKILTVEKLKEIFSNILLTKTDKVTKISIGSVLNGVVYGVAKIAQKLLKDIALIEARIFPDSASGKYLDEIAKLNGVPERFQETKSSTFLRLVAEPGTTYVAGLNNFSGQGINFILDDNVTVGVNGFTYAKVRSVEKGSKTNVDPLTIKKVNPVPTGHKYVINEYKAVGGRDFESDDLFRKRIKNQVNLLATKTKEFLKQVLISVNENVLNVFILGIDYDGKIKIGVSSVDGGNFTSIELNDMKEKIAEYLSLSEMFSLNQNIVSGYKIVNIEYQPIDISFRVLLKENYDYDEVRKRIQTAINKYLDWRKINEDGFIVDWIRLINIIKNDEGVELVPEKHFYPNNNIEIQKGMLPRVRGFLMLNLNGDIINDNQNNLNPNFYPNQPDFNKQALILKQL